MDPALLFGNGSEQIKRQKVDDTVSLSGSNESGASNLPMLAVQGPVKKQRAKKPPGAKNPNPKKKKASMPIIAGDVVVTNAPAPSNDQMIIDSTQIG